MAQRKNLTTRLDAALVFFSSFFVYLLTLYPTVGTEDSGELITSAATLDIAHPPGYPLYTLLGKLFTVIVPFGNIAWRVNLMSAFFAAATVTVVYLIAHRITKSSSIGIIAALSLAFSDIFWSQAIRAETYSLHTFSLAITILLLFLWDETQHKKWLYLGAFAVGLSLGNQHLMFLAGIPILLFVLARNWKAVLHPKTIATGLLLFVAGLSIYAYLPLRTLSGPYENPAYIKHEGLHDWESFSHFVNRGIYGGTIGSDDSSETQQSTFIEPIIQFGDQLITNNIKGLIPFFAKVFEQSFFLTLIFIIPGFIYLYRKKEHLFILLSLLLFFFSIVQLKFIGYFWDMHPFTLHSTRPFLLSSVVIVTIVAAVGIGSIVDKIRNKTSKKQLLSFLLFIPLIPLLVNFSNNNESHNYIAHDFNHHLLGSLPLNATFITTGRDNFTFPLYYLRTVEGLRTDVNMHVYYSRKPITQEYLQEKLKEYNTQTLFLDLLPHDYGSINLYPYNFVYIFGSEEGVPPSTTTEFPIRGIRENMDYQNNKLAGLSFLKMAIINRDDPEKVHQYFEKIRNNLPPFEQFNQFINDYYGGTFSTGMF